jgi:hypothetical protein
MIIPLLGLCYYNILEDKIIRSINDRKLVSNKLSNYHTTFALLSLILSFYNDENKMINMLIMGNSAGFFLNETLIIIKRNTFRMSDCVFIYHHIVSIIFFYNHVNDPTSYCKLIIFYVEISNIPSQAVYYLIQQRRIFGEGYNDSLLSHAKLIQFYVYGFLRIFVGTYLYYNETLVRGFDNMFWAMMPIFFLGYFWAFTMYSRGYHKISF